MKAKSKRFKALVAAIFAAFALFAVGCGNGVLRETPLPDVGGQLTERH